MSSEFIFLLWAVAIGGLSAISLPAGSVAGLIFRPRPSFIAVLTAFGAGALLAALAVELVAPIVHAIAHSGAHAGAAVAGFIALVAGAVAGGILFVILDQLLNTKGGFLRKKATTIAWFSTNKRKRYSLMLRELGGVEVLRHVPAEYVKMLVEFVLPVEFEDGTDLFHEGDEGDCLYFIRQGDIELIQEGRLFKEIGPGEVLGEIALLTGAPRTAGARAKGRVRALKLMKGDFDRIRKNCAELEQAVKRLAAERMEELGQYRKSNIQETLNWVEEAAEALRTGKDVPSRTDVHQARNRHGGASLGIWLGTLLDGIPESFVIGSAFLTILTMNLSSGHQVNLADVIPYTLIAGLFLSNFPEAMSSTVMMYDQGWKPGKIIFMWTIILVVTMAGAGAGYAMGELLPPSIVIGAQGMAAGAMLTMIASTMLPEAIHLGNPSAVGLSTLGGFFAALAFKLFE